MNLQDTITLPNIFAGIATILSIIALSREFVKDKSNIASTLLNDVIKVKDEIQEQRNEMQAEIEDLKSNLVAYKQQLCDSRDELLSMNKDIMVMQKKLKNLRKGVGILLSQLKEHDIAPQWIPDKKDLE